VPATRGSGTSYKKFRHPASGFAVVGVAAVVTRKNGKIDHATVGITGVAENAYRAKAVERALENQPSSAIAWAAAHAAEKVEALSDTFASAEYRRHIAEVYTRRALEAAYAAAGTSR
jgi:carbon-monoxide dehydrogenase medium subunit